jgi:hypothetical protein
VNKIVELFFEELTEKETNDMYFQQGKALANATKKLHKHY